MSGARRNIRLRRLETGAFTLLALLSAWYWFGSSGPALVALWLVAEGARTRAPLPDWRVLAAGGELTFTHVAAHRVLLEARGWGRLVVYRDEVGPADWARLRRAAFRGDAAQPATGRSTSS